MITAMASNFRMNCFLRLSKGLGSTKPLSIVTTAGLRHDKQNQANLVENILM
jgi:hypothetical protein